MIKGSFRDVASSSGLLFCALLTCGLLGRALAGCPAVCQCKWRDGKEHVTCQDADFIDIPKGLDPTTQVLDLRNNRLTILPRGAFIDTGLVNLQKVWMNFCQLRLLEQGAFEKLANLVELDLSDNYLNAVPTAALSDISGLRNLYLARNNLGPLQASIFTSVPSLVRLDVSYNNITSINVHAFRTLSRLEVLKLSGNHLTTLSVNVLKPLVALHGLHVDNNPWHCDCHLRLLRQWLFQRNVAASIPPHCDSPQRLKGRGWQTLGEDEFVCVPLVTAVAQRVLASHGDNVSLACRVETDPNAAVTWLVDDRPVINTSAQTDHRYRVLELVAPKRDARVSNLTIAGAAAQDQGIYRCVAENKAGRVETNLTLKVSHRIKETALIALDKVFVTGALFGSVVFIFIVCTISCAILYRRNKRTRMPIKVVSNTNQASPQVSVRDQNSQLGRMKTEVDYHVVPTSESFNKFKVVNEKNIITSKDGSGDQIIFEKLNPTNSSSASQEKSSKQNNLGLKGISKTVSYVEMPKSDGGETDPLLKEIYKETSFVRSTGFTSSQTSLIGYSSPFPDLLDLPRGSRMGSVDRLPFCTMPRRGKREEHLLVEEVTPGTQRPPLYHRPAHYYQRSHRFSLRAGEEFIKLREATIAALGGERIRWSSALSLELSSNSGSATSGQPPSLPSTPLTNRIMDARRQLAQMQGEDFLEDVMLDDESIFDLSDPSRSSSSKRLILSDPPNPKQRLSREELLQTLEQPSSDQSKLIQEIQKLRARKEELAKLRPGETLRQELHSEGDVTPKTQARQYEYHAQQLDRFLQEYRNLQEQLYRMKESCDNMRKKEKVNSKSSTSKNDRSPTGPSTSGLPTPVEIHEQLRRASTTEDFNFDQ